MMHEFISSIIEKRDAQPSFADGASAQRIADNVMRSWKERRWVDTASEGEVQATAQGAAVNTTADMTAAWNADMMVNHTAGQISQMAVDETATWSAAESGERGQKRGVSPDAGGRVLGGSFNAAVMQQQAAINQAKRQETSGEGLSAMQQQVATQQRAVAAQQQACSLLVSLSLPPSLVLSSFN